MEADAFGKINQARLRDLDKVEHLAQNEETRELVDDFLERERRLCDIQDHRKQVVHKNKVLTRDDVLKEYHAIK